MKFYQICKKIALPNNDIRPLGFILGVLLTLLWFSKGQPINIDGITYLQIAQTYLNSGFHATLHVYGWPFYPILIGLCSKFFGLSLFSAAKLLNVIFFGLIAVAFVSIARTLKLSLISQGIACFVILCYPKLINEAGQFYRDFGFYCFMLLGFNALLQFQAKEKYRWFIAWIILTTLGGLFRIEGLVFLFTMPVIILFWESSQKKQLLLKILGTYVVILAAMILFYFLVVSEHSKSSQFHALISADFVRVFNHITTSYITNKQLLKEHLLLVFGYHFAGTILISGVIGIIIMTVIKNMLPFNLFLSIYAWSSKSLLLNKNQQWIFIGFVLTYLIILAGFAFQHLFLSGRYVFLLCLVLFVPIAPAIEAFYKKYWRQLNPKYFAGYFSTFIVISALISLFASVFQIGANNAYYIQSSTWVNQNTPANAKVYMSDPRLTFYVKRNGSKFPADFPYTATHPIPQTIAAIRAGDFTYAMLVTWKAKTPLTLKLTAQSHLKLIKDFTNNRGDAVLIFQRQTNH